MSIFTRLYMLAGISLLAASHAHAGPQGLGGGELASSIDAKIEAAMAEKRIPGMTVAVTFDGRLVYSKGFGYSKFEYKFPVPGAAPTITRVPMKPNMRTRIGSVSKVIVTSPAAHKLFEQKNINPKTKKLYGPGGIFGNKFKGDINFGVRTHSPIVGMAINNANKTYTWYTNGKVSIGKTFDLDRHRAPQSFVLPEGKRVSDIRDIAISNGHKVYTWYNDGTLSIGSSRNLGSHTPAVLIEEGEDEGKPLKVKFPRGKNMFHVVGIAIAKTGADADHVYVWYEDGTLSSGTTRDFTAYFTGKPYSVTAGNPYIIRSMALSTSDHVYTWLANGKAQSGMSHDLGKYKAPYSYSLPPQGPNGGPHDRKKWAHDITIQHLLDHESGFQGKGSRLTDYAKVMYNKTDSTITYELIHRYFLRARPLRWRPGEKSAYFNHNFGLFTIIIKALSGKTYKNYAINDFLQPMGWADEIRPLAVSMDEFDAYPHEIKNELYHIAPAKNSTFGLAAGGWTAAAPSLLKVTKHLATKYSVEELDAMGWKKQNNKGKLDHNGRIKGGTSYVVMYPDGYVGGGVEVGNVHIALAANIWTSTGALSTLARQIAVEVPKSNIDEDFDLWLGIQ